MNVIKYRVSLDMFDTHSQTTIKAKKLDSACQIHITLTENGNIFNLGAGCHATFNAKKADGNFIYDNCTIENNTIVYDFSSSIDDNGICQVSAYEGVVECEVTVYKADNSQLTSPRFTLVIDGTVYNGEEIISSSGSDVIKDLIKEVEDALEDISVDIDTSLFASAIQNTVSGDTISVDDVSALDHTVKVQLSVNDEENLFDTPAPLTDSEAIEYHESVAVSAKIDLKDYTTYTIQFKCNKVGIGMHHHPLLTDGNQGGVTTTGEVQTVTFTTGRLSGEYPQQFLYADGFWEILCYDTQVPADIEFTNLAIAEGTTITGGENATDFTKVKLYRYGLTSSDNKITLTPNADGTVDVPSLSPYMTLETDKGNVTITATYNLDTKGYIDKKFEDFVNVAEVGV